MIDIFGVFESQRGPASSLTKHFWEFPNIVVPFFTFNYILHKITLSGKVWTCFAAWHLAFTELSVPWQTQHIWCDLWAFGARNSTNVQSVSKWWHVEIQRISSLKIMQFCNPGGRFAFANRGVKQNS